SGSKVDFCRPAELTPRVAVADAQMDEMKPGSLGDAVAQSKLAAGGCLPVRWIREQQAIARSVGLLVDRSKRAQPKFPIAGQSGARQKPSVGLPESEIGPVGSLVVARPRKHRK